MLEKWVETTAQVWLAIKAAHSDQLAVFSSYSNPTGDCPLGGGTPTMETAYGFRDADAPIMRAETTWDKPEDGSYKRENEKHRYWLCIVKESEEQPEIG